MCDDGLRCRGQAYRAGSMKERAKVDMKFHFMRETLRQYVSRTSNEVPAVRRHNPALLAASSPCLAWNCAGRQPCQSARVRLDLRVASGGLLHMRFQVLGRRRKEMLLEEYTGMPEAGADVPPPQPKWAMKVRHRILGFLSRLVASCALAVPQPAVMSPAAGRVEERRPLCSRALR